MKTPLHPALLDAKIEERIAYVVQESQGLGDLEWTLCQLVTIAFDAGVKEGRRVELEEVQKILTRRNEGLAAK